jgi:hypothetical protein
MSQLEHDRRIDYVEFPVAELAVWSDPVSQA